MDQTTPPSPALSNHDDLSQGFAQLTQHNETTSYPRDHTANNNVGSIQVASRPGSRYGTPVPHGLPMYYDSPPLHYYSQGAHLDSSPAYSNDGSPYPPVPEAHGIPMMSYHPNTLTPAASPPTPSQRSEVITLRSGAIARASSGGKTLGVKSGRVEKSTPKKKKERSKAADSAYQLDQPLSELTKDWVDIPVVDIETYVNRSSADRWAEVQQGKTPGKVKRPMNAFMLYRKAYQTRIKHWGAQHNHQIVSKVCGASWPLESEVFRKQYADWAETERNNHRKAHPTYKFTPAKPRKKTEDDLDEVGSDLDDYEWGSRGSRNRSRVRTPLDDEEYKPPRSAYASHYNTPAPQHTMGYHPSNSHFHVTNPEMPVPAPYDQSNLTGTYYQQTIRPYQKQHGVQDIMIRKTPSPSMTFHGLPGTGSDFDLSSQYPQPPPHYPHAQQPHHFDDSIHPSLFSQVPSAYDPLLMGGELDSQYMPVTLPSIETDDSQPQFPVEFTSIEDTLLQDPQHTQLLQGTDESWKIEQLDADHMDNWMNPVGDP